MMLAINLLVWRNNVATDTSGGEQMAEFNTLKKKKKQEKLLEKNPQALSVKFYGALKSKNEIYFQMASLFKEVTQAEKNQDEKILKTQWMEKFLISTSSDIHGKSFLNNI
jgi:hypothetical protein